MAIEQETGNLEEIEEEVVSYFAKKYKPVALKGCKGKIAY